MTETHRRAVPIPADETDRPAALNRYSILDTPSEAEFDDQAKARARRITAMMVERSTVSGWPPVSRAEQS
jgi:hypothetical protein